MAKKRKAASPLQPCSRSPQGNAHGWQSEMKKENDQLRQELSYLKHRIDGIEKEQDDISQRGRLVNLIFSGPAIPEPVRREETAKIIQHMIEQCMNHKLDMSQVRAAFRLRSGNIFVEFSSAARMSERDVLFRSKYKLRGTGLYISESLTPRRQAIFQRLVHLKKDQRIHSAYTQSGELLVRKFSDSRPIKIADQATM